MMAAASVFASASAASSSFAEFLAWLAREDGLPLRYHRWVNWPFLLQTLVCLIYCVATGRFLPAPLPRESFFTTTPAKPSTAPNRWLTGSIFMDQFLLMLILHTLVYVFEIAATHIYTNGFGMFLHHVFAFAIFALFGLDPRVMCFFSLAPFAVHAFYWITLFNGTFSNYTSWCILFYYNVVLFVAGFVVTTWRPVSRDIFIVIVGYACFVECFTNAAIYCTWYPKTTVCPPRLGSVSYEIQMISIAMVVSLVAISLHHVIMRIVRGKSKETLHSKKL